MGILQARILEWVAMPSSRVFSQPRVRTQVSCIGRWILYQLHHLGSPGLWVISSVQSLSCVRLFVTSWTAARQASLSITNSRSLPKLMSIELVMPSNHLILCHPLSSCLQSFPASGSFPMGQFFTSSGQSIRVSSSTSVLPMNIQD